MIKLLIIKILTIIVIFVLSTYLFYKAAGTLAINKLNLISCTYYIFILQTFIGISLVYLGFSEHYLVQKVIKIHNWDKTFFLVACTAVLLPLSMNLITFFLKKDVKYGYDTYLNSDICLKGNTNIIFFCALILTITFLAFTIQMFTLIGHVPLLDMIFQRNVDLFATRRIQISRHYLGNIYIRNIVILALTPAISYLAFTYAKVTKEWKWRILFLILFIASIFIKTYDYSKAPVVFYLFPFVLITIVINKGIKKRTIMMLGGAAVLLIVLMYVVTGGGLNSSFDIYNGPIGRTIFSPVGALILHVDLFPDYVPYLKGRSFAPTILKFLPGDLNHMRSARAVMKFYNPEGVYHGEAGVMNTFFTGEAYANFGVLGVVLSTIYIGVLLQIIYVIFLKIEKNPIYITAYATITSTLVLTLHGGFVDYIYNVQLFAIIFLFLALNFMNNKLSNLYKLNSKTNKNGDN